MAPDCQPPHHNQFSEPAGVEHLVADSSGSGGGTRACMVCPLELLNSLGSRIGLKKKVPRVLRSGWVITGFFAFILFGAAKYLGLQQVPRSLAIYLASVCAIAFLLGLIFEKRSFCSYVCPLGSIIGMYSYIACMEWRADDPAVYSTCKSHDCVAKKNRYKLFGRSCTSNLFPARITDNRDCLLCGNCLKACPYSNFRLSLRMPFRDFFYKDSEPCRIPQQDAGRPAL